MKIYSLINIVMFMAIASIQTVALAKDNGTALTDAQVTQLISGNTMYATNTRGNSYKMYFGANGYLKNGGGEVGTWKVKNGSICNTYKNRGFAGCDKVYRNAKNKIYYVVSSGKQGQIHKTKPGNNL